MTVRRRLSLFLCFSSAGRVCVSAVRQPMAGRFLIATTTITTTLYRHAAAAAALLLCG